MAIAHDVGADRVAQAWATLVDRSDEIADGITLTLFERDAEVYQRMGPELRADVRSSCRQHIRRGLEILSGAGAGESAKGLWRETGRRRARQGVPLEVVLNAYTLGARVLWEALVAHAADPASAVGAPGPTIDEQVLLAAARRVWGNLDVQNAVLVDAYRRESARLHRQDVQREAAAIDSLLAGRGADPAFAGEAQAALGLGPEDTLACVVVLADAEPGDERVADELVTLEDRLERSGVRVRWLLRSGTYVGLVSGEVATERELVEVLDVRAPGRIGVALSHDGLAGFATAHLLATRAAETIARHTRGAVSVSDRLPEVLLVGSPQVAPLLRDGVLGGVLAQPEAQRRLLLETLEALLHHDGSPTHAAEELFCHRNTVIYRLKRIEALTGRTLTAPRDKLLLGLALAAVRQS